MSVCVYFFIVVWFCSSFSGIIDVVVVVVVHCAFRYKRQTSKSLCGLPC